MPADALQGEHVNFSRQQGQSFGPAVVKAQAVNSKLWRYLVAPGTGIELCQ